MRLVRIALTGLLLLCAASPQAADLEDPAPIAIPEHTAATDVIKSIKNAMVRDHWALDGEGPGQVQASFTTNGHVAKVSISYGDKEVRVTYADSIALDFKQDGERRQIHHNYNKWVERLAKDIAAFDAGGDPDTVLKNSKADLINPPPSEKLSNFSHFEITPVAMDPPYSGQQPNEEALAKIQECLDNDMRPLLAQWNGKAPPADKPRNLKIDPHIDSIKFIGGGARFFVGAMAGTSYVTLRVTFTDADTGAVIASPHFSLRPGGSAGFMGSADNQMLQDIAQLVRDYTQANYDEAVGGTTGDGRRR